jgi:hypothetical protein
LYDIDVNAGLSGGLMHYFRYATDCRKKLAVAGEYRHRKIDVYVDIGLC